MTKEARKLFSFSPQNDQSELWAIVGGKRSVGVTTVAISLSMVLQRFGKKVLLIDVGNRPGNLELFLDLQPKFNLVDLVKGSATLEEALIKGPSGLEILTTPSMLTEQFFQEEYNLSKLTVLLRQLKSRYNYTIADLGSGISLSMLTFLNAAHKVLVVVSSDPASIADAYAVIKVVKQNQVDKKIALVANRVPSEEEGLLLHRKMNLITKSYLSSELLFGGSILADVVHQAGTPAEQLSNLIQPTSRVSHTLQTLVRKWLSPPANTVANHQSLYRRFLHESKEIGLGK